MSQSDVPLSDAFTLVQLMRDSQLSPVEVVDAALERAAEVQTSLNPFVTITEDLARSDARDAESALMRGDDFKPLCGIPITVKDNLNVAGVPTRSGSTATPSTPAPADSPAVERARRAGACILGKTTASEFAIKAVGQSPLTGTTRNPWDPTRTTGGSSAGGAAAVAAGIAPVSIVTDGGGSTRIPAALCGVFGIKPQFGRVPYLPVAATPSLSHVGCISYRAQDAELVLRTVSGSDPHDSASAPVGPIEVPAGDSVIPTLRVAFSPTLGYAQVRPDIRAAVRATVDLLQDRYGCPVETVDQVLSEDPVPMFYSEFLAGARARLAPILSGDSRDQLDPDVLRVLDSGADQTLADYMSTQEQRHALRSQVQQLFDQFDVLVTPTLPVTAFDADCAMPPDFNLAPNDPFGWLYYTYPFNLTGNPAVSIPCGFDDSGLPIGMQVVGKRYDEATLLAVATAMERAAPWPHPTGDQHRSRPADAAH